MRGANVTSAFFFVIFLRQVIIGLTCNPPKPGDESYEKFSKVSTETLDDSFGGVRVSQNWHMFGQLVTVLVTWMNGSREAATSNERTLRLIVRVA